MIDHTLTTSLALYRVHRDKVAMMTAYERRKAFWLLSWIVVCAGVAAYIWIIYL